MMPPGGRTGRGPHPLVDLERALTRRAVPNPAVVLWRWRYELVLLAVATALSVAVWVTGAVVPAVVTAGLTVAAVAAWPAARQLVAGRFWCVVTPHRVRTACAEAWLQNRSGKLPMVMWTSADRYGERVVLWCRAGMTAEDLVAQRATLATACWAEDVDVRRDAHRPHLVTLEVIRRRHDVAAAAAGPADVGDDDTVRLLPPAS
jgi:hypothetical protein